MTSKEYKKKKFSKLVSHLFESIEEDEKKLSQIHIEERLVEHGCDGISFWYGGCNDDMKQVVVDIGNGFKSVGEALDKGFKDFGNGMVDVANKVGGEIWDFAKGLINDLIKFVEKLKEEIENFFKEHILKPLIEFVNDIWQKFKDGIEKFGKIILSASKVLLEIIKDSFIHIFDNIETEFKAIGDKFKEFGESFVSIMTELGLEIKNTFLMIWDKIKGFFIGLANIFQDNFFTRMIDDFMVMISIIISAIICFIIVTNTLHYIPIYSEHNKIQIAKNTAVDRYIKMTIKPVPQELILYKQQKEQYGKQHKKQK